MTGVANGFEESVAAASRTLPETLSNNSLITNTETTGQVYFQHIISSELLLSVSGSVRDAAATLSSNPFATPVIVLQDRGYREGYVRADLAGHHGHHDWKEIGRASCRERV